MEHAFSGSAKSVVLSKTCFNRRVKDFPEAEIFLKNRTHLERAKDFLKLRSFSKEYRERMLESIERARSRWYSTREVIRLKTVYETLNGFNYDIVFLTRLDVGFYTRVDLDKYDPKCFYASNWNGCPTAKTGMPFDKNNYNLGQGLLDFWFLEWRQCQGLANCLIR